MEPAYSFILPAGTSIFRAKTINKEGRWYSFTLQDAYVYGELITEFVTNKDLKLINIMSFTFHDDFMDRLNVMFPGDDYSGINNEKLKCLIPLGLPDLQTQLEAIKHFRQDITINTETWNNKFDLLSKLMLNRHRFSIHELDTFLVSVLEKIYGSYFDGYISPLNWPTKLHGNLFHRELCTFKQGAVNEVRTYTRPSRGGGYTSSELMNLTFGDGQFCTKIHPIPPIDGKNILKYADLKFDDAQFFLEPLPPIDSKNILKYANLTFGDGCFYESVKQCSNTRNTNNDIRLTSKSSFSGGSAIQSKNSASLPRKFEAIP